MRNALVENKKNTKIRNTSYNILFTMTPDSATYPDQHPTQKYASHALSLVEKHEQISLSQRG